MWRKVGELFDKVQGINIGTVNCDEEGPDDAIVDGFRINRACTTCITCFPDYPVQALERIPTVRGFFAGEVKETDLEVDSEHPASPLKFVQWVFKSYPDAVDAATKERVLKEALEVPTVAIEASVAVAEESVANGDTDDDASDEL
jgi:hypothetical protein